MKYLHHMQHKGIVFLVNNFHLGMTTYNKNGPVKGLPPLRWKLSVQVLWFETRNVSYHGLQSLALYAENNQ
jgi:hypothetical protein